MVKVIRNNDPWYGMTEEEIEDRKEFIRCYINKDFELLLQIPIQLRENDFWFQGHQIHGKRVQHLRFSANAKTILRSMGSDQGN